MLARLLKELRTFVLGHPKRALKGTGAPTLEQQKKADEALAHSVFVCHGVPLRPDADLDYKTAFLYWNNDDQRHRD